MASKGYSYSMSAYALTLHYLVIRMRNAEPEKEQC